jgi:heme-degrading monooxygenase HmoA
VYASLGIFIAVPGSDEQMKKIAEQGPAALKGKKGFKSAVYFSDKAKNEYGVLTVWQTKADYDAFMKSVPKRPRPWFAGTLFPIRQYYVNNSFSSD